METTTSKSKKMETFAFIKPIYPTTTYKETSSGLLKQKIKDKHLLHSKCKEMETFACMTHFPIAPFLIMLTAKDLHLIESKSRMIETLSSMMLKIIQFGQLELIFEIKKNKNNK
jgi:hypothetical protein